MERLKNLVFDEWSSLPMCHHPESELLGIVQSLPVRISGEEVRLPCHKSIIIRRFLGLLMHLDYKKRTTYQERLFYWDNSLRKGGILLPQEMYHDIISIGQKKNFYYGWIWLRGVFGAAGSLYFPKVGYYLTLKFVPEAQAAEHAPLLLKKMDIYAGRRCRHNKTELMIRNQDHIMTFLVNIGLVQTSLTIEEMAMIRSMKNRANKIVNCDSANINKSLYTAQRQLKIADLMERRGLLKELPEELAELVEARKMNPSISLRELGLCLSRPVSKSTVEYRWKKIEAIIHNRT